MRLSFYIFFIRFSTGRRQFILRTFLSFNFVVDKRLYGQYFPLPVHSQERSVFPCFHGFALSILSGCAVGHISDISPDDKCKIRVFKYGRACFLPVLVPFLSILAQGTPSGYEAVGSIGLVPTQLILRGLSMKTCPRVIIVIQVSAGLARTNAFNGTWSFWEKS